MIAAAPLAAQDKNALSFGAGLSYIIPGGNLSDIASGGFGPSLFAQKPLTDKFAIRGSLDYIVFGQKTDKYNVNVKHDVNKWGVAADGIWSFTGHDTGPYALVSLGFQNTTWEMTDNRYSESAGESKSSSGLNYGVGLGYNLTRRISIEVKQTIGPKPKWWGEWNHKKNEPVAKPLGAAHIGAHK